MCSGTCNRWFFSPPETSESSSLARGQDEGRCLPLLRLVTGCPPPPGSLPGINVWGSVAGVPSHLSLSRSPLVCSPALRAHTGAGRHAHGGGDSPFLPPFLARRPWGSAVGPARPSFGFSSVQLPVLSDLWPVGHGLASTALTHAPHRWLLHDEGPGEGPRQPTGSRLVFCAWARGRALLWVSHSDRRAGPSG